MTQCDFCFCSAEVPYYNVPFSSGDKALIKNL